MKAWIVVGVLAAALPACDQPVPEEHRAPLTPVGRPPHPLLPPSNIQTQTIQTIIDTVTCSCSGAHDCDGAADPRNQYWTCPCDCAHHNCPAGMGNCEAGTPDSSSMPPCETDITQNTACGPGCTNCAASGQYCSVFGSTQVCCAAPNLNCNGSCASPTSNTTCGNSCTNCTNSGLVCATNGSSHICCASSQVNCGGACANPAADTTCGSSCTNCAASSKKCATSGASHVCCAAGLINCGGVCTDPTLDGNCGTCGTTCNTVPTPKLRCCNSSCADITLQGNCGACGTTCAAGTACSASGNSAMCCSTTTTPAQIYCGGGACVSPTSSANCGGCSPCAGGTPTCCGSGCYDTMTNAGNCGSCGTVCSTNNVDTGKPVCVGGSCNGTCKAGFADCNNNKLTTGCQTALNTDVANCGACTHACPTTPFGTASCTAGTCALTCDGAHKLCGNLCIGLADCCTSAECNSPPDDCHAVRGVCAAGTCTYAQIVCPDLDCQDHAGCKAGACQYSAKTVGTTCGGTGCYTARDGGSPTCQMDTNNNVFCDGAPKDCKAFDSQCSVGACDAKDGACKGLPSNAGADCTATDKCQINGTCQAGQCQATPKVCPAPRVCHVEKCDAATGNCNDDTPAAANDVCEAANPCLIATACDGQGSCSGTLAPDGTGCVFVGSCESTASCYAGQCLCDASVDMSVGATTNPSPTPDMGPVKKAAGSCKCDVGAGAPSGSGPWLAAALLLAGLLRRRRARA